LFDRAEGIPAALSLAKETRDLFFGGRRCTGFYFYRSKEERRKRRKEAHRKRGLFL
jgi:hypothetical protein